MEKWDVKYEVHIWGGIVLTFYTIKSWFGFMESSKSCDCLEMPTLCTYVVMETKNDILET